VRIPSRFAPVFNEHDRAFVDRTWQRHRDVLGQTRLLRGGLREGDTRGSAVTSEDGKSGDHGPLRDSGPCREKESDNGKE
jgi:hypothetical protein